MPTLATIIGLNEAIVLQQIHYWIINKKKNQQDYIDGHYWVYNTYEQWHSQFPFFSISTLRRTFKSLENSGLLLTANYNKAGFDKTKWYAIDYTRLDFIVSSYDQNDHIEYSNSTDGNDQNNHTNTKEYTEITPKTSLNVLYGAESKHNTAFDWSILEKQIIGACNRNNIDNSQPYIEIIEYYYKTYMLTFQEEHPRLSRTSMDKVISAIQLGTDLTRDNGLDFDMYRSMIDKHFHTQYKNCDYSISHFMTEGIRNNRFYETCY